MTRSTLRLGAALALLLAACNDSTGTDTIAAEMEKVDGDLQVALINTELPEPLIVRVVDRDGDPVEGVLVNWTVQSGGGSITGSSRSDAEGLAEARYVLGPEQGPQTAAATVNGLDVDPVGFTATAEAPDDGGGGGGDGDAL